MAQPTHHMTTRSRATSQGDWGLTWSVTLADQPLSLFFSISWLSFIHCVHCILLSIPYRLLVDFLCFPFLYSFFCLPWRRVVVIHLKIWFQFSFSFFHNVVRRVKQELNMKKIPFKFLVSKSRKNHSVTNICCRAFCLAPNKRELSNLLTLSISLEASISRKRPATFP